MGTIRPVHSNGRMLQQRTGYEHLPTAIATNQQAMKRRKREEMEALADIGPVVYYVWRNDLIKIGHTINLRMRLMQLQVKRSALLALEQGPMALEQQRHAEFVIHRVHGAGLGVEHYWPGSTLLQHINCLRDGSGLKPLTVGLRPAA